MPEIKIDLNVVLKLLSNLKPDKAAGPDSIKPVVLKMEIAPVICLLFEKNSSNRTTPFRIEKSTSLSLIQKGWQNRTVRL